MFRSEQEFTAYVHEITLPEHNGVFRGRRGFNGRKARSVDSQEAEDLARVAWANWANYESREDAERAMRQTYGFVEWFFFGWQIISLIRTILSLLYPTV